MIKYVCDICKTERGARNGHVPDWDMWVDRTKEEIFHTCVDSECQRVMTKRFGDVNSYSRGSIIISDDLWVENNDLI